MWPWCLACRPAARLQMETGSVVNALATLKDECSQSQIRCVHLYGCGLLHFLRDSIKVMCPIYTLSGPSQLVATPRPTPPSSQCHYSLCLGVVWSGFWTVCTVRSLLRLTPWFGFVKYGEREGKGGRESVCVFVLLILGLWPFSSSKRGCKMTWHLNHICEPSHYCPFSGVWWFYLWARQKRFADQQYRQTQPIFTLAWHISYLNAKWKHLFLLLLMSVDSFDRSMKPVHVFVTYLTPAVKLVKIA